MKSWQKHCLIGVPSLLIGFLMFLSEFTTDVGNVLRALQILSSPFLMGYGMYHTLWFMDKSGAGSKIKSWFPLTILTKFSAWIDSNDKKDLK